MKHRDLLTLPQSELQIVIVCKSIDASGSIINVNSDYPFIPIRVVGDVSGTSNKATWTGNTLTYPENKRYLLGFLAMGLAQALNGAGTMFGNTDSNEYVINNLIDKGQFSTESFNITLHSDASSDGTYYVTFAELRPIEY